MLHHFWFHVFHRQQPLQSRQMFSAGMHSSSTMSFEPGLEYGVPWGRDLFTFVTSAAGHMMRTLQKPRKNKPSKRQVNHRRFLHNMIQRKFAEIEAANHQLAAALFSTDSSQSQTEAKSAHKNELGKSVKKGFTDTEENETITKQQEEVKDSSTLDSFVANPDKSFFKSKHPNNRRYDQTNKNDNQQWNDGKDREENLLQPTGDFNYERELTQSESLDLDNLTPLTDISLDESVFMWLESVERIKQASNVHLPIFHEKEQEYLGTVFCDMSSASPAVSPLSLDSYDIEMQIQPESDHGSQMHPITDSLSMEMTENFELLDCSERYLNGQPNDQSDMVLYTQSKEDQSYVQDNLTLHNISHFMNNQKDCDGADVTGGLEVGSQNPALLDNPVKDVEHGNAKCSQTPCGENCHTMAIAIRSQTRYNGLQSGMTTDCYLHLPGISTSINEFEDQFKSPPATWRRSEEGLEELNFSNCALDCQVLQRHENSNTAITKYWAQQNIPKGLSPAGLIDTQYAWTDAQKSNTEVQTDVNDLSSPIAQCYGFDALPQDNTNYAGDSCSYSNGGHGQSQSMFAGVAQSFPAPMHKPHPQPVSTPPLNEDWLFSNIISEAESYGDVRTWICNYC